MEQPDIPLEKDELNLDEAKFKQEKQNVEPLGAETDTTVVGKQKRKKQDEPDLWNFPDVPKPPPPYSLRPKLELGRRNIKASLIC